MSQKTKVVNFSDLTEEEKQEYIRFMIENNINFEEDDQNEQVIAKVKIRNSKKDEPSRSKPTRNDNNNNNIRAVNRSSSICAPAPSTNHSSNNTSFTKPTKKLPPQNQVKGNNKSPFVLASSQNNKKNVTNKIAADYVSFRKVQDDPAHILETHPDQQNLFQQLFENIDLRKDTSPLNQSREFQRVVKNSRSEENIYRSRSVHQVEKKLNFEDGNSFIGNEKAQNKKTSIIDEYVVACVDQYKTFSDLTNLNEIGSHMRPKKLSADQLTKQIEEIFSARFLKETAILRATMNKGGNAVKSNQKANSFPYFVFEFLKERNKNNKYFEQAALSLGYSAILAKRKNYQVDMFSKFLAEEFDTEDLTFFLFVRSIVEKEMSIIQALLKGFSETSSTSGVFLTQKNCYKILEAVYGKEEKILVNRVFKQIKDHIEWEREKNIDFSIGKIYLYSFLKITLEDYHSSRISFLNSLDVPAEDCTYNQDQAKEQREIDEATISHNHIEESQKEDKLPEEPQIEPPKEEEQAEELEVDEKDDIDRYLFDNPQESIKIRENSSKALNDITNQRANKINKNSGSSIISNIHSSWYNNANIQQKNVMNDPTQDIVAVIPDVLSGTSGYSHSSFNSNAIPYMNSRATIEIQNNNTTTHARSNSSLAANTKDHSLVNFGNSSNKSLGNQIPRGNINNMPTHQNVQKNSSNIQSSNCVGNSLAATRNSYTNIHRRNSNGLAVPQNSISIPIQNTNNIVKIGSTGDLNTTPSTKVFSSTHVSSHNQISNDPSMKEISHYNGELESFLPVERITTKETEALVNSVMISKVNCHADNHVSMDKSMTDNFSFRNWDSHINDTLNGSVRDSERTSHEGQQKIPPQQNSTRESNRNLGKSLDLNESIQKLLDYASKLQDFCLMFMMRKVNEFIETMLFEGQEQRNSEEEKVKAGLLDLFERKFRSLLKALFSFDKIKWLNSLMVDEPSPKQLQNIEELQKDLRYLQKRPFDELSEEDIEIFANKIFRTPELSTQIGRLIVEFTLPQDLLYADDITE